MKWNKFVDLQSLPLKEHLLLKCEKVGCTPYHTLFISTEKYQHTLDGQFGSNIESLLMLDIQEWTSIEPQDTKIRHDVVLAEKLANDLQHTLRRLYVKTGASDRTKEQKELEAKLLVAGLMNGVNHHIEYYRGLLV